MRRTVLILAMLALACSMRAQTFKGCDCGKNPPGRPAERSMKPYAQEPDDLQPFNVLQRCGTMACICLRRIPERRRRANGGLEHHQARQRRRAGKVILEIVRRGIDEEERPGSAAGRIDRDRVRESQYVTAKQRLCRHEKSINPR